MLRKTPRRSCTVELQSERLPHAARGNAQGVGSYVSGKLLCPETSRERQVMREGGSGGEEGRGGSSSQRGLRAAGAPEAEFPPDLVSV